MIYEYSGYLSTILKAPDPAIRDTLPCVAFTADDLMQWSLKDLPWDLEWQQIPASYRRTTGGVQIEGRFNDVRQIDSLAPDDPSFWVALSSLSWQDARFPVDVLRYPIAEITYRCTSPNAHPVWVWTYPGGLHLDGLTPTPEWRTIARRVPHFGFPKQIDALILRLFSTVRGAESCEVASIRFREMSSVEAAACAETDRYLESSLPMRPYPVLDEFLPFGCQMEAGSSKRLAAMLGITFEEYWALAFEDLAKHYHNCVALEKVDRLTPEEWRGLLALAEQYEIKFVAMYDLPPGSPHAYCREFIDTHVKPYASSPSILAWSLYHKPPEHQIKDVVHARALLEEADPNHPLSVRMRDPNAFALFAPFVPVTGIEHFRSHVPWQIAEMVSTHLPLLTRAPGQHRQFWVVAPGFVYATDTPEWHSCPEIRMTINHALANGARGYFTFAFHNDPIWIRGSCQRSLTGPFLTFSDLWSELGQRVEHCSALAPLFLHADPQVCDATWFNARTVAHANAQLPPGMPPVSITRLCGADYEMYCLVSNDIRDMASVYIDTDPRQLKGRILYDLSDYVRTRQWRAMDVPRHLEMFPGQLHVILAAEKTVCRRWRDVIADRMLANDHRFLSFDLALVRAYGLDISEIETGLDNLRPDGGLESLAAMHRIRDLLLNRVYESPAIYEPRTKIIEASAAVCACDGSLCRLMGQGKVELARQLGFKVIPLAREFTNLRLDLRRGRGAEILHHCQDLAQRSLELLAEIRKAS